MKIQIHSANQSPRLNRLSFQGDWISYDSPECADNLLPQRLLELFRMSPTHSGILNKKIQYSQGEALTVTSPLGDAATESAIAFADGLEQGEGAYELFSKCISDYLIFGGFCLQVLRNPYTHRVSTLIHQDFSTVRRGFDKKSGDRNYGQGVWISSDWCDQYKFYPAFYPYYDRDRQYADGEECGPEFLYHKKTTPAREWYPLPDYFAGYQSIDNEIEMINWDYKNIRNSFNPSGILSIPSGSDPEVETELVKQVDRDMKGTDGDRIMIVFRDDEREVTWTPITESFVDKDSTTLVDRIRQNIILSHQIPSPTILGLPGGASLGGDGGTIEVAAVEFYKTLVRNQKAVLTVLQRLFADAGHQVELTVVQNVPYTEQKQEVTSATN